jgi:menaquinol-cytochrome c reductase cytochrome b/c subunit
MKPPASFTAAQKQVFTAGEVVVGQSGCLACHVIGANGNNGPGPPLTHIGSKDRPAEIASTLRNPTAPMPSFKGLATQYPRKFQNLVNFLAELQ